MPPDTVALTFDDGPDPPWTPQVLAVLAKYHVPGTFFVVGSSVARNPELLRQIRARARRSVCTRSPIRTSPRCRRTGSTGR